MPSGILKIKVLGDASHLDQTLSGATSGISKFGKLAGAAFVAAGAAVAGGIGASVKAYADFDAAMNESIAIMGDVSKVMRGEMSDAAREVAKTTTFSAEEAASAFYFLASAGLDAGQSISALPAVAQFAQAGMMDLERATELLSDSQSALGLRSQDAAENLTNLTRVSDVLVEAANRSNASIEQFGEALTTKAATAARAVGMEIEETVAVLSVFADQGVKGAEAGTQFAIVLRDLKTKALENKEAFAEFGVAVFDSQGNFNNMGDIIADLEDALEGMSDAEATATLKLMGFNDKSLGSILTLLGMSDAIKGYEKDLRTAGGTTEEIANKQLETFKNKLQIIKSKIADIGLTIGEALMPYLMRIVDWVDEHMPVIEAGIQKFFDFISGNAPGVGTALGGIGQVLLGVRDIFTSAWPLIQQAVQTFVDWLASDAGQALINSLLSAIGVVLQTLQGIFEAVWPLIQSVIQGFIDWLASDAGKALIETLLQGIGLAAELVQQVFETVWPLIQAAVQMFIDFFNGETGQKLINSLLSLIGVALEALQDVFEAVWPAIEDIVQTFIDFFNSDEGQWLINSLVEAISAAITALGETWEEVWPAMEVALRLVCAMIHNNLRVLEGAIWLVVHALQALKDLYEWLKNNGVFSLSGNQAGPSGGGSIQARAAGGLVTSPELALIGESGPELVLPLTNKRRTGQLLSQAGLVEHGVQIAGGIQIYITGQGAAAGEAAADAFLKRLTVAGVSL